MTQSDDTNYDATRDPRTGRPQRPIEAEASREKREVSREKREVSREKRNAQKSDIEAEGEDGAELNDEGINETVARMRPPAGDDSSGEDAASETLKKLWGDNLPERDADG